MDDASHFALQGPFTPWHRRSCEVIMIKSAMFGVWYVSACMLVVERLRLMKRIADVGCLAESGRHRVYATVKLASILW